MSLIAYGMLKTLLVRAHGNHTHAYARFLNEEEREKFESFQFPPSSEIPPLHLTTSWLEPIHYSWFASTLEGLPSEKQAVTLSLLTEEQAKGVSALLGIPLKRLSFSRFLTTFLSSHLKKEFCKEEVLPEALLPASELNALLTLQKRQLVHLIDLLGLYDLAANLKQVVDKTVINKIYAALSKEQLHFLHYCSKQPMKWVPPKLNITGWDGNKKSLASLLHHRGLFRFAKALCDENLSLQWHVTHRLDSGRGKALMKIFEEKHDPLMISYFKGQVRHLVKRYQKVIK